MVKSYLQQYGVDFDQIYAAIVKRMAFRVLFAIAAYDDLDIDQMDVKRRSCTISSINWSTSKFQKAQKQRRTRIWSANCSKLSTACLWYKRLSTFLLDKLAFTRIHADHNIFVTKKGLQGPTFSTFVDDIKIMGPKENGVI